MKCGQQLEQGWCRASLGGLWQAREEQHQQHARRRARQVCNVAHLHAAHPHAGAGGHHLELSQHLRQVTGKPYQVWGQWQGRLGVRHTLQRRAVRRQPLAPLLLHI